MSLSNLFAKMFSTSKSEESYSQMDIYNRFTLMTVPSNFVAFCKYDRLSKGLSSKTDQYVFNTEDSSILDKVAVLLKDMDYISMVNHLDDSFEAYLTTPDRNMMLSVVSGSYSNGTMSIYMTGDINELSILKNELMHTWKCEGILMHDLLGFNDQGGAIYSDSIVFPDKIKKAHSEFYPFLNGSPDQILESYNQSSANVLFLIGKWGTGKSTFLRHLLVNSGATKCYTVSSQFVNTDPNFLNWLAKIENGSMIAIEDAHELVRSRDSGNSLMASLLNIADGIVQRKLKIVISTNLPSVRDVDTALIREGRTHSVLKFELLSGEDIAKAYTAAFPDKELPESLTKAIKEGKELSLSKVLNPSVDQFDDNRTAQSIGFGSN